MYFKNKKTNNSLININKMPVSNSSALKNALFELNSYSSEYGLALTGKQINRLAEATKHALYESGRIEIGSGILPVIASEFCTSPFITGNNYATVLEDLIHIFFQVKSALCDRISDRDLIRLLRDYYENKCYGNPEFLRDRDIDLLTQYAESEMGIFENREGDVYESEGYTDERT